MNKMKRILLAAALPLALCGTASAQWQINEFVANTDGSPDPQFVELYNPTPNSAISGLSIVCLRGSASRLHSKIDIPADTATGNYYLIANADFSTVPQVFVSTPTPDLVAPDNIRTSYCTILLVPTASLDGAWTYDNSTGDVLDGTEFNNGADILDSITIYDESFSANIFNTPVANFTGASPAGARRFPDASGTWEPLDFGPTSGGQELPYESSPGSANLEPTSVAEWSMY